MNFDPSHHHRRSIRLQGYDYSLPGAYYVTICIENKHSILGKITENEMMLYEAGQIAKRAWEMLPQRFSSVAVDAFVVMPNRIHGVIQILDSHTLTVKLPRGISGPNPAGAQQAAPLPTLGEIVRAFKSTSAVAINRLLGRSGRRVWQRNYYEHIVRGQNELEKIRGYIAENPLRWAADRENPRGARQRGGRFVVGNLIECRGAACCALPTFINESCWGAASSAPTETIWAH